MHHHTQGASAPRYLFRVTHPQTRKTATLIASDQHEAATEFAGWHGLPVDEVAITQRSKGWFTYSRGSEPFDLQVDMLDMSASGRHYVILQSVREIRLKLVDVFAEHLLSDEAMDKLRAAMRRCGLSVDAFQQEAA